MEKFFNLMMLKKLLESLKKLNDRLMIHENDEKLLTKIAVKNLILNSLHGIL